MFTKTTCKISELLNKINKTECKECKWCGVGCQGGMIRYENCCGWLNKSFESK